MECGALFEDECDLIMHQRENTHHTCPTKPPMDKIKKYFLYTKQMDLGSLASCSTQNVENSDINKFNNCYKLGWGRNQKLQSRFSNEQKEFIRKL